MKAPKSKQPLPDHAEKVFSGAIFDAYQWPQAQYDGTVKTFEKLKRADTVLIIPIIEDGRLIFMHEEQPGKVAFVGFVGGRVEEGEDPAESARRELLVETGYAADELVLIEAVQPVTKIEWSVYTYVAPGSRKVAEQNLDSGEKIDLKFLTLDEAVELMARDDFADREGNLPRLAIRALYDVGKREELKRVLLGE